MSDDDEDLFFGHEISGGATANAVAVSFVVPGDLDPGSNRDEESVSSGSHRTNDGLESSGDAPTMTPVRSKRRESQEHSEGDASSPLGTRVDPFVASESDSFGFGRSAMSSSGSANGGGDKKSKTRRRSSNKKAEKNLSNLQQQQQQQGKTGMQGFIRGAAQKERIAMMKRHEQVSGYEILTLRNAFSFAPKCLVARDGGVDEIKGEHIREVLARLSVECSDRLLEALQEECPYHLQDHYDMADVMQIYVSLKRLQYVKLHSSMSWEDNPTIQRALSTKNLIIDTQSRTVWNLFMLVAAVVQFWVVLYRDGLTGLDRPIEAGYLTVDLLCSLSTAIDIFLWSRTAIVHRGRITYIDKNSKIRKLYLRSWGIPDLLSALPLDVICCVSGASIASGVLSHLRLLRVFRTVGFWNVTGYVSPSKGYILFHFGVLPLLKIITGIFIVLHTSAIVFWRIKIGTGRVQDLDANPYVGALYFVVQTYSTVGYGDIQVQGAAELWFSILLAFTALVANGLIIGKLVSLLQLQSAEGVREDRLRETLAVLEFFEIPTQLQSEILNFQDHVLWSKSETTFHSTISQLPSSMVENVDLLRRISIISAVPFLKDASEALLVSVARRLQGRSSKPEEYVTCSSDTHQGIRWLLFGYVDQLDPSGRYISTLKGGDYFGIRGLLESEDECYNYKALSYCDLLIFPTEEFHELAHQFPQFGANAENYLLNFEEAITNAQSGSFAGGGGPVHPRNLSASGIGSGHSSRIVAVRNLHTKLRNFKETLVHSREGLLGGQQE